MLSTRQPSWKTSKIGGSETDGAKEQHPADEALRCY